jgi:hypothetical protein
VTRKNPRGFIREAKPERRRCTTDHAGIRGRKSGKPYGDDWQTGDAPHVQDEPTSLSERRRLLGRKGDDTRTGGRMRPRLAGRVCDQGIVFMSGGPTSCCSSLNDQQRVANMLDAASPGWMFGFGERAPYEVPGNELWWGYANGHEA